MTKLHDLWKLGQSVWIDFLSRSFIHSGDFNTWLARGVRGMTSNPTIFMKAITGGTEYDADLAVMAHAHFSGADLPRPDPGRYRRGCGPPAFIMEESAGGDGFVSIEVNPHLAHDTAGTIAEARSIFNELRRPNVMIKIPATPAGIPAIEQAVTDGININVTLIFGREAYRKSAEAYIKGLENRLANGDGISRQASVASVFVSRLDTLADPLFTQHGAPDLQGKLALANAKLCYVDFEQLFTGARWERLRARGARVQRPLWASTGTKNPAYPDTMYVDELIGPQTVNTAPLATIEAYLDHGRTSLSVQAGLAEARTLFTRLDALGIDLEAWTIQLLDEGVASFIKSYDELLTGIEAKAKQLRR